MSVKKNGFKYNLNEIVIFSLCATLYLALLLHVKRVSGDDSNFPITISQIGFVEWMSQRYLTHSGRVFGAELFMYCFSKLPLFVWKVVNMSMALIVSVYSYRMVCSTGNIKTNKSRIFFVVLCSSLMFFMNLGAIVDGAFWITGSMNYLWPVALALVGMFPFFPKLFQDKKVSVVEMWISPLLLTIAANSQEQLGSFLVCIQIVFVSILLFRKHKLRSLWPYLLMALSSIVGWIINLFSPGNGVRYSASMARHIDNFNITPLQERLEYSIRWVFDALVNHMGIVLVILIGILFVNIVSKKTKKTIDYCCLFILSSAIVIYMFNPIPQLTRFDAVWGERISTVHDWTPFIYWMVVFFAIIIELLQFNKNKMASFVYAVSFIGCVLSVAIICLSPTMYVSGCRTMFVPTIILSTLCLIILSELTRQFTKNTIYYVGYSIMFFPLMQYVYLLVLYSSVPFENGVTVHFPW